MGMTTLRLLGLLPVAALLVGCGGHATRPADATSPVITRVADPRVPYPLADVTGRLTLRDDCLMIGDQVVFWPAGTSWDETKQEVVFAGDFAKAANARLDAEFTGGGGVFDVDSTVDLLAARSEAALRSCIVKTDASSALLAYPDV